MKRRLILGVCGSLLQVGIVAGQDLPPYPEVVVVFDYSPEPSSTGASASDKTVPSALNSTYVWAVDAQDPAATQFVTSLRKAVGAAPPELRLALLDTIRAQPAASTLRSFSEKGAWVEIYVFHSNGLQPRMAHQEDARDTRFDVDITKLAKIVRDNLTLQRTPDFVALTAKRYQLTRVRANLKITVTFEDPSQQVATTQRCEVRDLPAGCVITAAAPPQVARTAQDSESVARATTTPAVHIITGPREHVFLSANAGSSTANQVTYDDATGALGPPEDAPSTFFLAINFALGDLYTEPQGALGDLVEGGFYIGAFVHASKRPLDQIGVLTGFRHNIVPLLKDFVSFEVVSPFVGLSWAKNDVVKDGAVDRRRRYGKGQFFWGVSFNLDQAVEWLTPNDADAGKASTKDDSQE